MFNIITGTKIYIMIGTIVVIELISWYVNTLNIFVSKTVINTNHYITNFKIGEYCLTHNQCPLYAFCSGTCQCPKHYYYDPLKEICTIKKTHGASCSNDFECNNNVKLKCISSKCQCESLTLQFWNATYELGGDLPNGRCQKRILNSQSCRGMNLDVSENNLNYEIKR